MSLKSIIQPPHIMALIEQFKTSPRGFFLMSGRNGTGKSYAALQLYNSSTPYRLPARDDDLAIFINQSQLNMEWVGAPENAKYLLKKYCDTRLLVLDDVGTRTPTDPFMDFLYAIADSRYNDRAKKGTIITTNLTSTALREKFGDAFCSRAASGLCFRLDEKDRRLMPEFRFLHAQG